MDRQARQLRRIVDDLLDVTRITQGRIQLRRAPVDLTKPLEAAVESTRELIDERRHDFSLSYPDGPLPVLGDVTRLEQILVNLLTNAAKYTPDGGRISLTAERTGSELTVRCRDSGVGISGENLPLVFVPFAPIDPGLKRKETGLGIGLKLVKRLTEMHGGSVSVSSDGPGRGCEFVLRLPALPEGATLAHEGAERSAAGPAVASLSVLVVDDNQDLAEGLAMFLRDNGHRVAVAHDGIAGISLAEQERPDVVLLDLGLPGMDGFEAAKRIREMPDVSGALVIAISGYPPSKNHQSRSADFDAHLVKPIAHERLLSLMQMKLASREPPRASSPSRRILLVEDNDDLARITADLIRDHGLQVIVALSGEEGIQKAREFRPDVIICDLHLPSKSGFDTARELRRNSALDPDLLIGLTAGDIDAYEAARDRTPFDLFLSKPLVWSKLCDALENLNARKRGAGR